MDKTIQYLKHLKTDMEYTIQSEDSQLTVSDADIQNVDEALKELQEFLEVFTNYKHFVTLCQYVEVDGLSELRLKANVLLRGERKIDYSKILRGKEDDEPR